MYVRHSNGLPEILPPSNLRLEAAQEADRECNSPQNITGHFILPGRVDIPFTYHITRTYSSTSYAWRQVSAHQNNSSTPSFIATISFKRSEAHDSRNVPIAHQSE